jgi:hypothetical protein
MDHLGGVVIGLWREKMLKMFSVRGVPKVDKSILRQYLENDSRRAEFVEGKALTLYGPQLKEFL